MIGGQLNIVACVKHVDPKCLEAKQFHTDKNKQKKQQINKDQISLEGEAEPLD